MKNSSLRHALFSLLACVMLLAACSSGSSAPPGQAPGSNGGGDGPGAVALIRAVSGNVQDAGSYRATFEFVMGAQGRSFRASGDGEFSNDPLQAHVNYRFDGLPLAQGEMEMEMIIDGSVMYMRAPTLTEGSMFATEWISMDLDELAPGFSDLAELSQGQNDPTAAVEYLRGIEDAEEIGTEDVAGVETTHYRGTIDLDSAYDRLPADARGELEQALAQARKQFGGVSMPVDVWIDSDGLLRRMTFIMKTGSGASMPLRMEMTMEIPEYGITLDLPIPEASDVTDLGDLASLSGGSGGWS